MPTLPQEKPEHLVILRRQRVVEKTGHPCSTLYRLVAEGKFPPPIKLAEGGRSVGWLEHEVDAYIASRVAISREQRG